MADSAFESRNPYTGEVIDRFDAATPAEADAAIARADAAQRVWAASDLATRAAVLAAAADALEARADELASALALEMGKPVGQGRAEAAKCAALCRHYSSTAEAALAPRDLGVPGSAGHVRFDPLGTVLGVMPWNYPIWQTLRFATPSLLLGNGVIIKPAPNVVRTNAVLAEILAAAGLPEGVLQTVLLTESQTLQRIRDDPRIAAVTLTGSARAGRAIAAAAGAGLKKSVLELGGSDPFIVLDDADIPAAARTAAAARTQNAGQSCIAAKRFIVHRRVATEFVDGLIAAMSALQVGDPAADGTELGPLARADVREVLHDQVAASVHDPMQLRIGGRPLTGSGFGYQPAVVTDVDPRTRLWTEETFGPVAAVRTVADDAEALALANRSSYGLGASLWTSDVQRAAALAEGLHTGMVTVNDMVRSDPRIPFGGVKESGYGRELGSWGWYEFANIKAVQLPT